MQFLTNIYNAVLKFQDTNQYLDLIVIALILMGGFFAKKYLEDFKMNMSFKTLLVGTVAVILYTLILMFGDHSITPTYWKRAFISYCVATSFYELLVKYMSEIADFVAKFVKKKADQKLQV